MSTLRLISQKKIAGTCFYTWMEIRYALTFFHTRGGGVREGGGRRGRRGEGEEEGVGDRSGGNKEEMEK